MAKKDATAEPIDLCAMLEMVQLLASEGNSCSDTCSIIVHEGAESFAHALTIAISTLKRIY